LALSICTGKAVSTIEVGQAGVTEISLRKAKLKTVFQSKLLAFQNQWEINRFDANGIATELSNVAITMRLAGRNHLGLLRGHFANSVF